MKRTTCIAKTFAVIVLLGALTAGCTHDEVREETTPKTAAPSTSTEATATIAKEDTLLSAMPTTLDLHPDVRVKVSKGKAFVMQLDGMMLAAVDSAVLHDGTYTATALNEGELPKLPSDHVNVTAGSGIGYRLLPGGEHFSPYAELRVAYDEGKLPKGYTPDDIHTSYYDTETGVWTRLVRKEVDTLNKEIVSLTTHFTDFVNEVLKTPEMPETQAFVPTSISELEAANPMEGYTTIAPPEANNMGTANLTYPIIVPAGRQGLQPNLALTYNSNGGNGVCGVGWDLPIPCVSVETRWGVPLYDPDYESETYLLNGEQLLVDYNSLPTFAHQFEARSSDSTKRFYPRVEGSFDSIIRHCTQPNNYWWEVVDRNGTRYLYGEIDTISSSGNLEDNHGNIAKWYLTKVIDRDSNSIRYYYSQQISEAGTYIRLDKIVYGIRENDSRSYPYGYGVFFDYDYRKDNVVSGVYGLKECIYERLKSIKTAYLKCYPKQTECTVLDSVMIRGYMLTYQQDDLTQQSQLKSILELNRDEWENNIINHRKKHTFTYNPIPDSVFGSEVKIGTGIKNDARRGLFFLRPSPLGGGSDKTNSVNEGAGGGVGLDSWLKTLSAGGNIGLTSLTESNVDIAFLDINGDGYPDIIYKEKDLSRDNGKTYCKLYDPHKANHYEDTPVIVDSLPESIGKSFNLSNDKGINANAGFTYELSEVGVNLGTSWTDQNSVTQTYFADVNADGFVDIIHNGQVYYNITEGNNLKFATSIPTKTDILENCEGNYYSRDESEPLDAEMFKPGHTDSVHYVVFAKDRNDGEIHMTGSDTISAPVPVSSINSDTIRRSVVRMWVAPKSGAISISGTARLDTNFNFAKARQKVNADGVRVSIQQNMSELRSAILDTILDSTQMDVLTTVAKNDRLYFRVEAMKDRHYDVVNWSPVVQYTEIPSDSLDCDGRNLYRYDAANDFLPWDNNQFTMPMSGSVILDASYLIEGILSDTVVLMVSAHDTISETPTFLLLDTIAPNFFGTSRTYHDTVHLAEGTTLTIKADSKVDVDWKKLHWHPHVRSFSFDTTTYVTDSLGTLDTIAAKPYSLLSSEDSTHQDTIYSIDIFLSPQYKTYVTHSLPHWHAQTNSAYPIIADPYTVLADTVRVKLFYRTATEAHVVMDTTAQYFKNNGKLPRIAGMKKAMETGSIDDPVGINSYYEFYIAGQVPDGEHHLAGYLRDGSAVGIKFDSLNYNIHKHIDGNHVNNDTLRLCEMTPRFRQWQQFAYNSDTIGTPIIEDSLHTDRRNDPASIEQFINDIRELDASGTALSLEDVASMVTANIANPYVTPLDQLRFLYDSTGSYWVGYGRNTYLTATQMGVSNLNTIQRVRQDTTALKNEIIFERGAVPVTIGGTAAACAPNKLTDQSGRSYYASLSLNVSRPIREGSTDTVSGGASIGGNVSEGTNNVLSDYMDMNGDGYPDIISASTVHYTNTRGGLSSLKRGIAGFTAGIQTTDYEAKSLQVGCNVPIYVKTTKNAQGSVSVPQRVSGKNVRTNSVNGSSDVARSNDSASAFWIDINGDGLPDKYDHGLFFMNIGYAYVLEPSSIPANLDRQTNTSINRIVSASDEFSDCDISRPIQDNESYSSINNSFSLGLGVNFSDNYSDAFYADLNGDGLPDKVVNYTDKSRIYYNTGWGYPSNYQELRSPLESASKTYHTNINGSVTLGGTQGIFKFHISPSASHGSSASRTESMLIDMNNDGLPDYVKRDGDTLIIRYNQCYKAGKLSSVKSFYGNKMEISYAQAPHSDHARQRPTVMSGLTIYDTLASNTNEVHRYAFEYKNYRYHTGERTTYGFDSITVTQFSEGEAYRKILQVYHNNKYKLRGIKNQEVLTDPSGNILTDQLWFYQMKQISDGAVANDAYAHCFGPTYPAIDSIVVHQYDTDRNSAGITTAERFIHEGYGRVSRHINYNDIGTAQDNVISEMTYTSRNNNQTALPDTIKVFDYHNTLLRHRTADYDALGHITKLLRFNGYDRILSEYGYDGYGNLTWVKCLDRDNTTPLLYYLYDYDSLVHIYRTKTENSLTGDTNWAVYDVRLGVPLCVYANPNDSILYRYDDWGRVVAVRAPLEGDTNTNPTIVRHYWDDVSSGLSRNNLLNNVSGRNVRFGGNLPPARGCNNDYLWAQTHHYSSLDPDMHVVTYLFTDGFGRVAQTRKTSVIDGVPMQVSSGKMRYDDLGRVVEAYDPFLVHDIDRSCYVQPEFTTTYTASTYDLLDRKTSDTVHFDSRTLLTTYRYGFSNVEGLNVITQAVTNPRHNTTTVSTDARGLKKLVVDALGNSTLFRHDALGQLVESIDPEGFSTTYSYDMLGELTSRNHPDAGLTTWSYNFLGQPEKITTAAGEIVSMVYYAGRLTEKHYSNIPANDVTYRYANGRIVEVNDGSGRQQLSYDHLGNVSQNIRTFALPYDKQSYTFTMDFEYDSWGRMVSIGYPDGEEVRYAYNRAGDLFAVSGQKGTFSYKYIDSIWYNAYGGKDMQWYGNGTFAQYSYDGLHRLSHLLTGNGGDVMQDIDYTYDNVGNIVDVANSASNIGPLGETSLDSYSYDDIDRLNIANLNYGGERISYTASYSESGRMMHKYHPGVPETPYQNLFFGYCNKRQPHAPQRIVNFTQNLSWDIHDLSWDKKGNLARTASYLNGKTEPALTRHLFWTEDNRLHTVVDENYYSYYSYDHTGERVLKLTGDSKLLDVNGYPTATGMLDNVTLYTSPYLVVTPQEYTKHYYAGSERICAKLGNGGFTEASFTASMEVATDLFKLCQKSMNRKPEKQEAFCVQILGDGPGELMSMKLEPPAPTTLSDIKVKEGMILNGITQYLHDPGSPERDIFFYHGDHLGSASWITDAIGTPIQHIRYLPYGETYVNERTSGYNERFTFTGKELDEETGYGYFGARYIDHELMTMWLSVDPMSDKYPSLSPYNYCAWNPVKLVDPDGEEMLDTKYVTETGGLIVETNDGMNDPMKDVVIISKERQSNFENKVRELDLENTLDNPNNRSVLERYGESLSDYKDDFCRSGDDSYLATGIRATYQDTYDGKSTFWFRLVYNLGALGEGAMGQETTTAAELSSGARLGYDMGSYDRINGLINRINPYQTLDRTLKEGPSYHRLTTAERNSQKKEWHPYICY